MLLIAKTPEYKKLAGLEKFFEIRIFSIFRGLPSNFLFFTKNFVIFLIHRLNATQKNMGASTYGCWVLAPTQPMGAFGYWVLAPFRALGQTQKNQFIK